MRKLFLVGVLFWIIVNLFAMPVFAAPIESSSAIPEPPLLRLQVPISDVVAFSKEAGGENITAYLAIVYQWLIRFTVVLSILMFTIAGFMWITAGGESGQIKKAHEFIKNTLIGLALALGSYVILWNTNPDLVKPLNLHLGNINAQNIEIEALNLPPSALTKSCEEICKNAATAKGPSWTSMSGTPDSCTPGTETTVALTIEACVKDDPIICKCVLLPATAGAPNCRTTGCGAPYFCDLPSNTCKDRLAEDQPCDLTIPNHCADGLLCKDVSGTKKCVKDAVATVQGTCCYQAYESGTDGSGTAARLPVAQGPTTMTYADCLAKDSGTSKSWWFCKDSIPAATACGPRKDLSSAFPGVRIPDGAGGTKPGTATEWTFHSVTPVNSCTLFSHGAAPRLF